MTHLQHHHDDGGDHEIGRLIGNAYRAPVDVETASRHLWRLHQVARGGRVRGARRTLVSALAAVLLFATTGTAVALSGQALPGDSLYPVKRGAERVHLLVSFAPESDARLHLRFARSRVAEAERVAATRPETVPRLVSEIVDSVDRATEVGGQGLSDEVDLVRAEAATALSSLGEALDAELAESVGDAIRVLDGGRVAAGADADEAEAGAGGTATEPGAAAAGPATPPPAGAQPAERAPHVAPDRVASSQPGDAHPEDAGAEPEGAEPELPGEPGEEAGTPGDGPAGELATPAPAPSSEPDAEEVAVDSTMPTLERLEGLLRP